MKRFKHTILYGVMALSSVMVTTSCSDWLELAPEDNYGSGSYWQTEAQVTAYIDGIHKHLRDAAFQHSLVFGELRGGMFRNGATSDGNTASYGNIILQNFDEFNTGVTKFGDVYGRITNLNLFIARVTNANYISEAKKKFFLGQVYGLRAFYYFDLYRVYGGVPLRLTPDVVDGVTDPTELYMARSTPKEVMAQIKSDIATSLNYFGDVNDFDPYKRGNKVYWSKAATESLKGEVYLWTSKVTTGDDVANEADLVEAKKSFESVVSNYSLSLQPSFDRVFDVNNKANSEIIFAIRYLEGEATNNFNNFLYNMATGSTKNRFKADGTVFGDPLGVQTSGTQTSEYNLSLFNSFDDEDSRKLSTFIASYAKDTTTKVLSLYGTHVRKNIGYINAQGARIYNGDMVFYRLPLIYLSLAEIANMEGNNAEVERYINLVRERAYGEKNWKAAEYGYKAGDFTQNELAILAEKDKEFIQEGQRWWDVRRMTLTKGGKHLVFCAEGNPNGSEPLLNEATEAHKVLWPLERTILNNDPKLEQTPGY